MLSLFFFFFFKQKTAYEMRISDWSSDVCSSDLAARHEGRPRVVRDGVLVDRDVRAAERRVGVLARVSPADQVEQEKVIVRAARHDAVAAVLQIGRASSRERVCQYV